MSLKKVACATIFLLSPLTHTVMAQGQLNMICSSPQPVCDAIVAEYVKQTSTDVSMIRLSSGEAYAKLRAEARNPKTDIWFSGTHDPHYQAADENLTLAYRSPNLVNLIPQAQAMAEETGYKSVAFDMGILGFVYNQEVLEKKGLPVPTSWADLLRPEYRQEIALSNPNTAGTGYSILVALVDLLGEDQAFDYLKKLSPNVATYNKTGNAVAGQAARGEVAIAILFLHDANILVRQGFPLKTVTPSEGTGHTLNGVSIVRGARNLEAAKAFMDWILTPEAQSVVVENGLNSYPAAKGTKLSEYTVGIEGVKLLDLDRKLYGSPEKRQALLSRWGREIGAIAGQ